MELWRGFIRRLATSRVGHGDISKEGGLGGSRDAWRVPYGDPSSSLVGDRWKPMSWLGLRLPTEFSSVASNDGVVGRDVCGLQGVWTGAQQGASFYANAQLLLCSFPLVERIQALLTSHDFRRDFLQVLIPVGLHSRSERFLFGPVFWKREPLEGSHWGYNHHLESTHQKHGSLSLKHTPALLETKHLRLFLQDTWKVTKRFLQ